MSLYRCEGVASKESNLVPCRNEDPCCVEVGELWKVRPDIPWSPRQDGGLLALSVEDSPCSTVVHISPERCHNPSVPGNWKSHRCELRHLPQERHKAIVVYLRRREQELENVKMINHTVIYCATCQIKLLSLVYRMRRGSSGSAEMVKRRWTNRGILTLWGKQQHGAAGAPITDVCTLHVANRRYL